MEAPVDQDIFPCRSVFPKSRSQITLIRTFIFSKYSQIYLVHVKLFKREACRQSCGFGSQAFAPERIFPDKYSKFAFSVTIIKVS